MVQFPSSTSPEQFKFNSHLTSMSTIGGMFGGRQGNVQFTIDSSTMKIETSVGTRRYSPEGTSQITVSKIQNPRYMSTFPDFVITIFDKDKSLIAQTTSASFSQVYETTSGEVNNVALSIENNFIE